MLSSILWLVLVLISTRLVINKLEKRRIALKAKQLGCLPAPTVTHASWDPLALAKLRRLTRAAAAQKLPNYVVEREKQMSELHGFKVTTMNVPLLGSMTYFTSDPKNIQAVLATQFQDFEIGPVRAGNFGPLLGMDCVFVVEM